MCYKQAYIHFREEEKPKNKTYSDIEICIMHCDWSKWFMVNFKYLFYYNLHNKSIANQHDISSMIPWYMTQFIWLYIKHEKLTDNKRIVMLFDKYVMFVRIWSLLNNKIFWNGLHWVVYLEQDSRELGSVRGTLFGKLSHSLASL